MNVLFVSSSFKGGGISAYASEVVNCFKTNHSISVIIGDDSRAPLSGVKVYRCNASDTSYANACKMLHLITEEIKPDVIINSFGRVFSLIIPYLPNNIRVISVSHSLRYNEADVAGINSQYSDSIIALSNYNAEYLKRTFHIPDSKIIVIYNCVEDVLGTDTKPIEKKKANKPLNIVFVGGTTAAKSPEIVFRLMKSLNETEASFQFYFLGPNTPTFKKLQPFKSISSLYPFDSRFVFTGRVPRDEAQAIIRDANIFLIPSRREGCPMALLEAMRFGAIIITSDFKNACREIISDRENGIIIPHKDIRLFSDTVLDIINNHKDYYYLYDNSYQSFLNGYSVPVWRDKMNEIMNSSLPNHKKRKNRISKLLFMRDRAQMKLRFKYNRVRIILVEDLKSATFFWGEYFKKK